MSRRSTPLKEDYYVVDSIIGRRGPQGSFEYRVRWQGYSDNDATWEPLQNLTMVMEMVEMYDQQNEKLENSIKNSSNRTPTGSGSQTEKHMNQEMLVKPLDSGKLEVGQIEPPKRKPKTNEEVLPSPDVGIQQKEKNNKFKKPSKPSAQKEGTTNKDAVNNNEKQTNQDQQQEIKEEELQNEMISIVTKGSQTPKITKSSSKTSKIGQTKGAASKVSKTKSPNATIDHSLEGMLPLKKGSNMMVSFDSSIGQVNQRKVKRIDHCIIKYDRVMYQVEYYPMKNKPALGLMGYQGMTQECKDLVARYYEKSLLLLSDQEESQREQPRSSAGETQGQEKKSKQAA